MSRVRYFLWLRWHQWCTRLVVRLMRDEWLGERVSQQGEFVRYFRSHDEYRYWLRQMAKFNWN